ncbi:hypothetical protein FOA52_007968 [Chlamydomonas sp. UWO 241]|nr:hypothetical protein FOA52_007968 [Chlamydomonas sp. UWO 241]
MSTSLFRASRSVGVGRTRVAHLARHGPISSTRSRVQVKPMAIGGPPDKGNGEGISRDDEPEEYWASPLDKPGANPFKDPLAIIGILAILFPFIFVLIAIGTGAIDTSVYR